ncbi:MAG: hypothetical protein HC805_05195 [Alkalinema sp. RL_2_19]|nr:hypothetical protein [Alkalinema sp. RL_2_19]
MLHRKLQQFYCDGHEVNLFLRDQQRWIERAKILDIEGNLVTVRYELEDEEDSSSWEEILLLESIGSVSRQLSFVPRMGDIELLISDDCPESEQIAAPTPESEQISQPSVPAPENKNNPD